MDAAAGSPLSMMASIKYEPQAWSFDSEQTSITYDNDTYAYQCGMYRSLEDDWAKHQLKAGDSITWIYGYKLFATTSSTTALT